MRVHHLDRHTFPDEGGGAVPQPGNVDGVVSDESADGCRAAFLTTHCELFIACEEGVGECLKSTNHLFINQLKYWRYWEDGHLHWILRIVLTGNKQLMQVRSSVASCVGASVSVKHRVIREVLLAAHLEKCIFI